MASVSVRRSGSSSFSGPDGGTRRGRAPRFVAATLAAGFAACLMLPAAALAAGSGPAGPARPLSAVRLAATTSPAPAGIVNAVSPQEAAVLKGFTAHRAVYDLGLESAESNAGVSGVTGRMVYEITGAACDGFSVTFRMMTDLNDDEGGSRLTDLRTTSFEAGDGVTYQFLTQNFVDQEPSDSTKGVATRKDGHIAIDLIEPEKMTATIDAGALFPTQHLARLIVAARAGQRIVQADLFDGSEDGRKVYTTTAIVGPAATKDDPADGDDPKAVAALKGIERWPVRLSYFDINNAATGEQTPVYEMSFLLYANGVTRRLKLDYGDFVISSHLKTIDMLPKATCAN
ncbi:cell envelope integrity EipB family protein [Pseudoxanthobacter sp.]|uniref:cell envelope integrity EipB family protein n=1 Tax=Pseudoxanthobacter sp. TaxID=1925742 RepID=UPI002FDFBB5C